MELCWFANPVGLCTQRVERALPQKRDSQIVGRKPSMNNSLNKFVNKPNDLFMEANAVNIKHWIIQCVQMYIGYIARVKRMEHALLRKTGMFHGEINWFSI